MFMVIGCVVGLFLNYFCFLVLAMSDNLEPGSNEGSSKRPFEEIGSSCPDEGRSVAKKNSYEYLNWDTDEDGEFTPFTQSRSPPQICAKKSAAPSVPPGSDIKTSGRGPADCLNWDDSDDDIFAIRPMDQDECKTSSAKKAKKNLVKNPGKGKRGSCDKGKSVGKFVFGVKMFKKHIRYVSVVQFFHSIFAFMLFKFKYFLLFV